MPRFSGFIGGANTPQSLILDAEDTINLYVEKSPQAAAAQNIAALFPTPGFTKWAQVADVGARGMVVANGRLFVALGGALWEFAADTTATKRGALTNDGLPAQFAYNGVVGGQLGIASGGAVQCLTLATNVLSATTLVAGVSHLDFAGGVGLGFQSTTGKVFESNLNDLTTWNAGTFFQRSLFADPWQTMFVDPNNLVWLVGTDTFEVWQNTGVGTQPFAPLSGLVGKWGIAAPFAYASTAIGNGWLARNKEGIGRFVVTRGSVPQPVSTYAVNAAVAGYLRTARIDDAEVLAYEQEGHTFFNTAYPSAKVTWTYDGEGDSWAKRGRWSNGAWDIWAPRCHAYFAGMHLVGDRTTGIIWKMDTSIATDIDGAGIRRLRRAPHLNVQHQRLPFDQFEIHLDSGLGLAVGQGSDPQTMLRISEDGGRTFGNELQASVGKLGEWGKRCYWTNLGCSQFGDTVVETTYSEPTPFRVIDAFVNNVEQAA